MKELTIQRDFVAHKAEPEKTSGSGWWSIFILLTISGSAGCMLAGLLISLLSWLGVIAVSQLVAYITVGLLLSSFSLIFLGAHGMDRAAEADRTVRERNGEPISGEPSR